MAIMAEGQRRSFTDRLRRIEKGGPNTTGTVYAGVLDDGGFVQQAKRKKKRAPGRVARMISLPFALAMGGVAMLGGRIAAFHMSQNPEQLPVAYADSMLMWADLAIAAVLVLLLGWLTGILSGLRKYMAAGGVAAVLIGEAAIIQQAPEMFIPVFSEGYVAEAMAAPSAIEDFPAALEALQARLDLVPVPADQVAAATSEG